jgi:adenine C2-methylase RlmN of 23S rRNA A2503 and tRNA A37
MISHLQLSYHSPKTKFRARTFDEQESYMLFCRDDKHRPLEIGVYIHWFGGNLRDVALDLSMMSGCTERCVFCASAIAQGSPSRGQLLDAQTIVDQVDRGLAFLDEQRPEICTALKLCTISFEGMGEPSWLPAETLHGITTAISRKYSQKFKTQFLVSTNGARPDRIAEWADLGIKFESVQLSLHAPSDELRRRYVGNRATSIDECFAAISYYHKKFPSTLIKINYLLINDGTSTNFDRSSLEQLAKLMKTLGKGYQLKLARLNQTDSAEKFRLYPATGQEVQEARAFFDSQSIFAYYYGPELDINISCGQLASYEERKVLASSSKKELATVYDHILDGNAVLFLGAGVSTTVWNTRELTNALAAKLELSPEQTRSSTLQQVVELYEAANRRDEVHKMVSTTLLNSSYPDDFRLLANFPWRAIYTTNYDCFVERAYEDARRNGDTPYSLIPLVDCRSFQSFSPSRSTIPLYKLHGCVSHNNMVISRMDYLRFWQDNDRMCLCKKLEADLLDSCFVFSGFSFSDDHLARFLLGRHGGLAAGQARVPSLGRMFSVMPVSGENQQEYEKVLAQDFGIKVINARFNAFLREIEQRRKSVTIFVSGSLKPGIPKSGKPRDDMTIPVGELCKTLGQAFKEQEWRVVSGATKTDKAGHRVCDSFVCAGGMLDSVRTILWAGAGNDEYDNEIRIMRNPYYHGNSPSEAIARLLRECNVAVFIGGSRLCLEEIFASLTEGKLVIPVRLKDPGYASSILYDMCFKNRRIFAEFNKDISPAGRLYRRIGLAEFLNPERLRRLDLNVQPVDEVAKCIVEIIKDFERQMWPL